VKEREDSDDSEINTAQQRATELGTAALNILVEEMADKPYDATAAQLQIVVNKIAVLVYDKYPHWSKERQALFLVATIGEVCSFFSRKMLLLRKLEWMLTPSDDEQP
jgi:hypothetical protein